MSDKLKYTGICALVVLGCIADYATGATAYARGGLGSALIFGTVLSLGPAAFFAFLATRSDNPLVPALVGASALLSYGTGVLSISLLGWIGCVLFALFWVFVPAGVAIGLIMAGMAVAAPAAKAAAGVAAATRSLGVTARPAITGQLDDTAARDPWLD